MTDAACVLGFFDPANFLGGRKTLDVAAAERIVEEKIAKPLGARVETAAHRILRQAAHVVATDVRRLLAERGPRRRRRPGSSPPVAPAAFSPRRSRRRRASPASSPFPLSPVFSAFGLSRLDLLHVYEARVDGDVRKTLEALSGRALRDMRGEGADLDAVSFVLEGEIGNGDGSVEAVDLGDAADLGAALERAAKHREALRLFRLKASVPGRRASLPRRESGTIEPCGSRAVVWQGTAAKTPVYDWDALRAGATIAGPAIVESGDTTVPVPPGTTVRVGTLGEIRVTRMG